MLDRARPELVESDLLRPHALDPGLDRRAIERSGRPRTMVFTIATFVLVELLAALAPADMASPPAPLLVDGLGLVFGWGMLAMLASVVVPRLWAAGGALGLGAIGLGLHAWCGLAGHVPMTAGWYLASGAAIAAYTALGAGMIARR